MSSHLLPGAEEKLLLEIEDGRSLPWPCAGAQSFYRCLSALGHAQPGGLLLALHTILLPPGVPAASLHHVP